MIMGALFMVASINAQRPGRGVPGQGRAFGDPCAPGSPRIASLQGLELSDEQQDQLKDLRLEHYKTMKPLRTKAAELRARQRTLLAEEEVDMGSVNKLIDEETELMNQIRKEQVAHRVEMKNMLTDEQLMKLEQRRGFRKNRMEQGNEFRRGPARGRSYHRNVG